MIISGGENIYPTEIERSSFARNDYLPPKLPRGQVKVLNDAGMPVAHFRRGTKEVLKTTKQSELSDTGRRGPDPGVKERRTATVD